MKRNQFIYAILFVCGLLVTSCTQDDVITEAAGAKGQFLINVTDSGVQSDAQTKAATDKDYITTFVNNDKIGLYAVKDGAIVEGFNNVCITFNGTNWTSTAGALEYTAALEGASFYAYYPYQSTNPAFAAANATPFAGMASSWVIGADQSGDNFTKYDLMTSVAASAVKAAKGNDYTLSFSLKHEMAMVVVKLPATSYNLKTVAEVSLGVYSIPTSGVSFSIGGTETKPYYEATEGKYRMLIKPATTTTLSGSFNSKNFSQAGVEVAAANYQEYTVDGGASTASDYTLQVGDFYCKDGSLIAKGTALSEAQKANVIGVVYFVGNPQPSVLKSDKYTEAQDVLRKDFSNCVHGLVMGLGTSTSAFANLDLPVLMTNWFMNESGLNAIYPSRYAWDDENKLVVTTSSSNSDAENNLLGYNNTYLWKEFAKTKSYDIIALNTLKTYADNNPTPSFTTGWYIPSLGEMKSLAVKDGATYSMNSSIMESLTALSEPFDYDPATRYWTSSDARFDSSSRTTTMYIYFKADYTPTVAGTTNNNSYKIRFAFAF